jgi:hypothetical protein
MKKFVVAVTLLSFVSAANAASLSVNGGSVMVNKGEGFVSAVGSVDLKAGDKVLVGDGGFADLAYDTCVVSLSKPTVHVVSKVAPCNTPVISPVADVDAPVAGGLFGGAGALAGLGGVGLALVGAAVVIPAALVVRKATKKKKTSP